MDNDLIDIIYMLLNIALQWTSHFMDQPNNEIQKNWYSMYTDETTVREVIILSNFVYSADWSLIEQKFEIF